MATTEHSLAFTMHKADFDRYRPNFGLAIFRRLDEDRDLGHGLVKVAKSADERGKEPTLAEVIRLGPPDRIEKNGREVPWTIREGDRVMLDKHAGHDLEIAETGERYVVGSENDLFFRIISAD
jgi:co-chaperonin GroES (HSP10)